MTTYTCTHCGQVCGDYAGGYAGVSDGRRAKIVCHPNDPSRPDCYRRVTVYSEPLGSLIGVDPKPSGVLDAGEDGRSGQ